MTDMCVDVEVVLVEVLHDVDVNDVFVAVEDALVEVFMTLL